MVLCKFSSRLFFSLLFSSLLSSLRFCFPHNDSLQEVSFQCLVTALRQERKKVPQARCVDYP